MTLFFPKKNLPTRHAMSGQAARAEQLRKGRDPALLMDGASGGAAKR